jgi:hypothetical protein
VSTSTDLTTLHPAARAILQEESIPGNGRNSDQAVPPKMDFADVGIGSMRSSGTYMAMMLQMESPQMRASILAYTAHALGITLEELAVEYKELLE